jgi:hypothetical protein
MFFFLFCLLIRKIEKKNVEKKQSAFLLMLDQRIVQFRSDQPLVQANLLQAKNNRPRHSTGAHTVSAVCEGKGFESLICETRHTQLQDVGKTLVRGVALSITVSDSGFTSANASSSF